MKAALTNIVVGIYMLWTHVTLRTSLLKASLTVEKTQEHLLLKILRENSQTEFEREHNFERISSVEEFRERVPINDYNNLEPYITRQQEGNLELTVAEPVFYTRTSGTTGRHKYIPLTRSGVNQIKHFQKQLAYSLWRKTDFFKGTVLGFLAQALRED